MTNIKDIKTIIFDLDGTLYRLDGTDGGFSGSTLYKKVVENSIRFIQEKESVSIKIAEKIWTDSRNNNVGPSVYFADKYKISRDDYFDIAWDIDPKNIVRDYEESVKTVKALAKSKQLILLTAAPRIWKENVLKFLKIRNLFLETYSGEMYQQKSDIFTKLSSESDPKTILSVGDQMHTDIVPARNVGMNTFLVSHPDKLISLCKNL